MPFSLYIKVWIWIYLFPYRLFYNIIQSPKPNVMHCHSRRDSEFLMTRWMKINTRNSQANSRVWSLQYQKEMNAKGQQTKLKTYGIWFWVLCTLNIKQVNIEHWTFGLRKNWYKVVDLSSCWIVNKMKFFENEKKKKTQTQSTVRTPRSVVFQLQRFFHLVLPNKKRWRQRKWIIWLNSK